MMQAVPWTTTVTAAEPSAVTPAVFDWAAGRGWLLAAGGTTPSVVHTWDLRHEQKQCQACNITCLHFLSLPARSCSQFKTLVMLVAKE